MISVDLGDTQVKVGFHHQNTSDEPKRYTEAFLVNGEQRLATAKAVCHVADNFDKALGRKIAFTRLIQNFDKDIRTAFWDAYLNHCKV